MGLIMGLLKFAVGITTIDPWGVIIQGDYLGSKIFPGMINSSTEDPHTLVVYKTGTSGTANFYGNENKYDSYPEQPNEYSTGAQITITRDNIDHYVDICNSQSGPDAGAFISGAVTGGVLLGAAAAMGSASNTTDIAVYLTNGEKFVVHFYTQKAVQRLKQIAFKL